MLFIAVSYEDFIIGISYPVYISTSHAHGFHVFKLLHYILAIQGENIGVEFTALPYPYFDWDPLRFSLFTLMAAFLSQ